MSSLFLRRRLVAASIVAIGMGLTGPAAAQSIPAKPDQAKKAKLPKEPLKVGDKAPDFELLTVDDRPIKLSSLLEDGPVVLTYYRGGWCPYCSTELTGLLEANSEIKARGAHLLAISGELPENGVKTRDSLTLTYDVLTDPKLKVARTYGLVFRLDKATVKKYAGFGIDVAKAGGTNKHELPIPVTYVIDTDGVIRFAYTDENYTKRADPADVIAALDALNAKPEVIDDDG